ncbi:heavy metal-associated isoprenylated plant protein 4-like [Oryza brachyantha]|uniref:HMA domain-containing protein n=1 Tax=Oryza brachyantha TaxID=4533 RepID=J3L2V9_ORYBR|nr:heavy metal-associated isoprenylated plant protein 4-like [Oryza brachyantha]
MKIVLKVPITCKKCKSCILQTVSRTKGIKSLTYDDEKSTLTVIGEVDVVVIVDKLRHPKSGKGKEKREGYMVEVMSVSDEKKEAEEKKKKDEEEKKKKEKEEEEKKKKCAEIKKCVELQQQCCKACQPYYIAVDDHPGYPCTIV